MTEEKRIVYVETSVPEPGNTQAIEVESQRILICNIDGELFAVENQCTHAKVLLTAARLVDGEIECPVHGARFDPRTGAVMCPPAKRGLQSYPIRQHEAGVQIELD